MTLEMTFLKVHLKVLGLTQSHLSRLRSLLLMSPFVSKSLCLVAGPRGWQVEPMEVQVLTPDSAHLQASPQGHFCCPHQAFVANE